MSDHGLLLVIVAIGVGMVLVVLGTGRGAGGRLALNVLLGLLVIAGAAALYGYSGQVSDLLFGAR